MALIVLTCFEDSPAFLQYIPSFLYSCTRAPVNIGMCAIRRWHHRYPSQHIFFMQNGHLQTVGWADNVWIVHFGVSFAFETPKSHHDTFTATNIIAGTHWIPAGLINTASSIRSETIFISPVMNSLKSRNQYDSLMGRHVQRVGRVAYLI